MRKIVICLLLASLLIMPLSACSEKQYREASPDEVVSVYEDAGFTVFSKDYSADDEVVYDHYIKVENDGEAAHIYFYESAETAEEKRAEIDGNVGILLFSFIFGDPMLVHAERYGMVVIEYEQESFKSPLQKLAEAE